MLSKLTSVEKINPPGQGLARRTDFRALEVALSFIRMSVQISAGANDRKNRKSDSVKSQEKKEQVTPKHFFMFVDGIGLYCASEKDITEEVVALYYANKGQIYVQLAPEQNLFLEFKKTTLRMGYAKEKNFCVKAWTGLFLRLTFCICICSFPFKCKIYGRRVFK